MISVSLKISTQFLYHKFVHIEKKMSAA